MYRLAKKTARWAWPSVAHVARSKQEGSNGMINRANIDQLEDAIEEFEQRWSEGSHATLEQLLEAHGLADDHEAIAELIRVDIEWRYERGTSIELDDYLRRFELLRECPTCVADIAFEDYRSRSAHGYSVSAKRWSELPGVSQASWFKDLMRTSTIDRRHERALVSTRQCPTRDASFQAGLIDHGFELIQQIASGAFSRVYLATQTELADRYVVLKVVDEALTEPEHMALLQHTNIVPIYSFHRIESRSVICMPYAGRVTLDDFLRDKTDVSLRGGQNLVTTVRRRIDDTQVASHDREVSVGSASGRQLARPAADDEAVLRPLEEFESLSCSELAIWLFVRLVGALAHAHARGVLHNDLKPSNVLIRNDGEPALLDFNLSHSLTAAMPRHAGGTLPYMAPEAYAAMMGQEVRPHAQSDLYSAGVMLFQFVTGRLPYPVPASPAPIDLSPAMEARKRRPDWRVDDASIPPGLRSIIDKCLQFDPEQRYATAEQLQTDLQQEQRQLPLITADEPAAWRLRKWLGRHPRLVPATAITVILLGILIPLTIQATRWRRDNEALQALSTYRAFQQQSTDILSRLMADPRRQAETAIGPGVELLTRSGLNTPRGLEQFLGAIGDVNAVAAVSDIRRHALHLAILEAERLKRRRRRPDSDVTAKDLDGLNELIRVGEWVASDKVSRSRMFLQADQALLNGQLQQHQRLLAKAIQMPADTDAERYFEAVRLLAQFRHVAASETLTALADRDSIPSALRWTMLGRAQFAEGDYEEAKLSFTQSIERAPASAALYIMRGRCFWELRDGRNALDDFHSAIAIEPGNRSAWSHVGLVHLARRQSAEAIRCFNEALKINPDNIWTLLKRSQAYQQQGETKFADADFDAAMNATTGDANELMTRALARVSEDPEAALEDLRLAHQISPDRTAIMMEIGRVLAVKLQRYEQAEAMYARVLEVEPENEFARIDRALALVRSGRSDEALREAQRAMEEPNLPRNVYQAACVHALVDRESHQRRAVSLIAKAIQGGYRPGNLGGDPDLASLQDVNGFRAIVRFYEMAEQAFRARNTRRGRSTASEIDVSDDSTSEFTFTRISER